MKHISIKLKITLWFTLMMMLIVALVLMFMISVSNRVVENDVKRGLKQTVEDNINEIDFDDGELEVDDDFVSFSHGVYIFIYSESGELILGSRHAISLPNTSFSDGTLATISTGSDEYYLYDQMLTVPDYGNIWVRGIILTDASSQTETLRSVVKTAFLALPVLVVLAAIGGYLIAVHSFRPLKTIIASADTINEGDDLSKRIEFTGISDNDDELHQIASTFDNMLDRLERSFEAEKQFTSDASHELRTPTAVILAQCELALEKVQTNQEYKDALEVVQRQGYRMSKLISQLLAYTRLEQGTTVISQENTDLSELTELICVEQADLKIKDISLLFDVEPNISCNVDRALYSRLLNNLISNAYKYGKSGGTTTVKLFSTDNRTVTVSVSDNGVGIAQNDLDNIWQRFYRASQSRTDDGANSMGLGLAMVKQIARLHGATVSVNSVLDIGSCFTVIFPKNS